MVRINDLLDSEGFDETCYDCEHYQEFRQRHPYGEGYATETLGECNAKCDGDCPRLVHDIEDMGMGGR